MKLCSCEESVSSLKAGTALPVHYPVLDKTQVLPKCVLGGEVVVKVARRV